MTISAALIDLDGTVYRGDQLVPGAADGIADLIAAGITPVFLSNNATKRPAAYQRKLADLGIDVPVERILNSAVIAADFLEENYPDARLYVAGEPALVEELETRSLSTATEPERTDVVLLSLYRSFDYGTLEDVLAAERATQPPIYATNPDRTCPVENGEIPDCGAVIGAVEGLLGRPIDGVLGKPSSVTIEVALDRAGVDAEECLMIGDRLETDIRMGTDAGMQTVLVASGVTERADVGDIGDVDDRPDYVVDSLADVAEVLE